MFKADLDATGIVQEDSTGKRADFHALRHTFISNLASGGVHPKVAQSLARHSDINLTMSRYTHTFQGDETAALEVLPDLTQSSHRAVALTGQATADIPVSKNSAFCSAESRRFVASQGGADRPSAETCETDPKLAETAEKSLFSCINTGEGGIRTHEAGHPAYRFSKPAPSTAQTPLHYSRGESTTNPAGPSRQAIRSCCRAGCDWRRPINRAAGPEAPWSSADLP